MAILVARTNLPVWDFQKLASLTGTCAVREDVVEEGSEGLEENVGSVLVTVIGNTVRAW